jgi:acyl-coenzyme A thioesterase PaaI-like protein
VERQGPFWDVMEGRADPPPVAELLGFRLIEIDPGEGTIEVGFTATEQSLNPEGELLATATATASIRRQS